MQDSGYSCIKKETKVGAIVKGEKEAVGYPAVLEIWRFVFIFTTVKELIP